VTGEPDPSPDGAAPPLDAASARAEAFDAELGELAELHGAMIDECARVGLLVLGDRGAAEAAAVDAFVQAHRRWYSTDDRAALVRRSLARVLAQAVKVPRPRPEEPLSAAFASLPFDQRLATAFACGAGLRGDDLAAALGTDAGEAEARRVGGLALVAGSLAPGTDVDARCLALPGVSDADETLLEVLRGVTPQVHVRRTPRWVLAGLVVGVVLLALAIVLSIDWSDDDGDVRITGIDAPPLTTTSTTDPG
jgi:hypothetical protein